MNITITINTDNAAFCDNPEIEVARILNGYSEQIVKYGLDHNTLTLYDFNGNNIGKVKITKK